MMDAKIRGDRSGPPPGHDGAHQWEGDQLIIISAFWDAALQARQLGLASV
jgi:hypothetical protein